VGGSVKTQFSDVFRGCGMKQKGGVDRSEVGEWKGLETKRSDDNRETDNSENTFLLGFLIFLWRIDLDE
jgi:hypothetical protein